MVFDLNISLDNLNFLTIKIQNQMADFNAVSHQAFLE